MCEDAAMSSTEALLSPIFFLLVVRTGLCVNDVSGKVVTIRTTFQAASWAFLLKISIQSFYSVGLAIPSWQLPALPQVQPLSLLTPLHTPSSTQLMSLLPQAPSSHSITLPLIFF